MAPACIASNSHAQILPFNSTADASTATSGSMTVGGTPAMDMIRLTSGGTGAPLRFGNVIKNSELVMLNGVKLSPGLDYSMDYSVGVVYLCRSYRDGDSVTVQYRYDGKAPLNPGSAVSGLPTMKLDLMPGGMSMHFGIGQTERTADGKVLQSNVWGTRNNFSGSGGLGLTGAYFTGSRAQQGVTGSMNYDSTAKAGQAAADTGNSSFLVQQFNYALGGGAKLTANIQQISKNFTSFGAVKDAGYKDDQVAAYTREKGLKREGMGLSGLNLGNLKFSASEDSVSDGKKSISASSYSMNNGGLSLTHTDNTINRGFSRFQDLGVADWQKMSQSQAIRKSSDIAALKSKFGAMTYSDTRIEDLEQHLAIRQSELGFDSTKFGFKYTTQGVDKGFNRFEADRATFGLEAGIKRQSFALTKGIVGKDTNILFAESTLGDSSGELEKRDVGIIGNAFSVTSSLVGVKSGFNRFGSLNPTETDSNIKSIAGMYNGVNPNIAAERGNFSHSNGLSRENTTIAMQPGKDSTLKISDTTLTGAKDKASVDSIDLTAKGLKFNMRTLGLGTSFNEVTSLMGFEQQVLGSTAGLKRSDMSLNLNMGKKGVLDVSTLSSQFGSGASVAQLDRTKLSYVGQGVEAGYNKRNVGTGFTAAGQVVDPEQGYLASLIGFNETDSRLKLSSLKNMKLEYTSSSAFNQSTTELKENDLLNLGVNLDKNTLLGYYKTDQLDKTSNSTLLASSLERLSISRKFGNSSLSVLQEKQQFTGTNATPDVDKTSVALETKLDKNTSLRTEQTQTNYSNGNKEDINSNTLTTQIAKNAGVSLTNTSINRSGDANDETKKNVGFWYDFGKGLRVSYGYVRQLTGQSAGSSNNEFSIGQNPAAINPNQPLAPITGGNVNGTTVGYSSLTNQWDNQAGRTQAFSSFALATNKPFSIGFMEACKLNVNSYMASDNSRWLKEDVTSTFESHVAKYGLGFNYRGQVDQQGKRAIDRTYIFKTDPTNKAPLSGSMSYKQRVMPDNKEYAIRDYQVKWQATKAIQISNQIQTNPEGPANPNIVLGTLPMAQRRNIWRADYTGFKNFTFGGQFDEMKDDTLKTMRRTAGMNFSLFGGSGSPMNFFYGIEQNDSTLGRNSYAKFGISFDQRPSANQVFSFSVGNQGWLQNTDHTLAGTNDWVARLNYQWRIGR